jgi:oligopeptidase A
MAAAAAVELLDLSTLDPETFPARLEAVLQANLDKVDALAEAPPTWSAIMAPLEALEAELSALWGPLRHLNAVNNSEALRACHDACLPLLTNYSNTLGQHRGLYGAYEKLAEASAGPEPGAKRALTQALRGFRLSGIDLPSEQQAEYRELTHQLSELSNRFTKNLLDATDAFSLDVQGAVLKGLPEDVRQRALTEGQAGGGRLSLNTPTYLAVMTYAEDRSLRETFHKAWITRASELGEGDGQWDNAPLMVEILRLRQRLAELLGFENYAERQLVDRMAGDAPTVLTFLQDLAQRAKPQAEREFEALAAFAKAELKLETLAPWDVAYASEQLRKATFSLDAEALRPYFPLERVLRGLFQILHSVFAIELLRETDPTPYHPDIQSFSVRRGGEVVGHLTCDLFARKGKRAGAWMDGVLSRRHLGNTVENPRAYVVANFAPGGEGRPPLLTHDEVLTLFHEFGHAVHHLTTQVDIMDLAGINGVPWDAVELPSQFLENWCWTEAGLNAISGHYETDAPLPEAFRENLLAARNFQSALGLMRQLELSLFDFRLHQTAVTEVADLRAVLEAVRRETTVVPVAPENRFENSFAHIFAGGYAAGYYSYKWAEVLAADAFSRFEEAGVMNPTIGEAFRQHILERGGSEAPEVLFERFRGRPPRIDALLRHCGIEGAGTTP